MSVSPASDIARLAHVELLTPAPEASLAYFRDVLGMAAIAADGDSVFLRCYGDYACWSLKLTAAAAPGVGVIAWRASSEAALDRVVARIDASALGSGWTDGEHGVGRSYRFTDPDGHRMAVFHAQARYVAPPALASRLKNQPMRLPAHGVGVRRIDHLALLAGDVARNRAFVETVLGLRLREQVRFDGGRAEIGSWLGSNAVHHELAYVVDRAARGRSARLHHYAMWVDNREDVLRAADFCREAGIHIEAGPSRHNLSQAFYLYCIEPGGNRVEIYSGGYLVLDPDYEPVIWNEAERGPGVYWGQPLPATFQEYATPAEPLDGARPVAVAAGAA